MNDIKNSGVTTQGQAGALTYQQLMQQAIGYASDWLAQDSMFNGIAPQELRQILAMIDLFPEQGIGDEAALKEANDYFLKYALQVHHPLCSAHLHCPTTLASQIAEVLINITNQSMDSWDQSPSATLFEERIITALRERIGYPQGDAGVFTSGGTQSNLMGLLLAREYYKHHHDAVNSADLVAICSTQSHFSVQQSMMILGFNDDNTVCINTDVRGCLDINHLNETLAQLKQMGKVPFILVATAGTTDTGAIDDLEALALLAQQHRFWLHVDAAWGGILLFSKQYRDRIKGIEKADSITLDFHKQFLQTISCGAFVLKDAANYELIRRNDDYLNPIEDELDGLPNLVAKSLQTTRRFDALKLWMSFRSIGMQKYAEMIDHSINLAQQVASYIKQSARFELVNSTQISSVLFQVVVNDEHAKQSDQLHRFFAQLLFDQGKANLGITRREGKVTMKMTLLNPNTTFDDVKNLLDTIEQLFESYC